MFKKRARKRIKYKYEESAIKPNVELAIDDLADYQQVFKKEQDMGYKGLQVAFENKSMVKLITLNHEGAQTEVIGTISHYDGNYAQLVVITGNSLKRLTFDQIVDVQLLDGGISNEGFSD